MNTNDKCPRCEGQLKSWSALSDEEREVVRRLPGASDYGSEERERSHQWCTRCWHELTADSGHHA